MDDLIEHSDGKGSGADGGIADFDLFKKGGDFLTVLITPMLGIMDISPIVLGDKCGQGLMRAEVGFQIVQE